MSKSTGNNMLHDIFTGKNDKFSKPISSVIRFFMLQAHYSSILDISEEALDASEKGYRKLIEALVNIRCKPGVELVNSILINGLKIAIRLWMTILIVLTCASF